MELGPKKYLICHQPGREWLRLFFESDKRNLTGENLPSSVSHPCVEMAGKSLFSL
jgi:hypothetical protein